MRTAVLAWSLAALAATAGCSKSRIRSSEGQYCSTRSADDPHYECSPAYDLVCINTYDVEITSRKLDGGFAPVWLCRLACAAGSSCPVAGDVCCPGMIYGRTYGASHACVPSEYCQKGRPLPGGDGGAGDAGVRDAGVTDTGVKDAGVTDGASADAGATDAPSPDAAADTGGDGARSDAGDAARSDAGDAGATIDGGAG